MKNFTAAYLSRLKRKLLDDSGNSIMTIRYSDESNENFYIPPSLEFDLMETRTPLKKPILRQSKDLIELRDAGIILCSAPVNENNKFKSRQSQFLFLAKMGEVPINAVTVMTLSSNGNKKGQHVFIFDDANKRVKLSGPYAGPMNEGPWIDIEEELVKKPFGSRPTRLCKIDEYYAKTFGRHMLPHRDTGIRNNFVEDVPTLVTLDGTLVCIPRLPEMGLIGILGKTGSGKTLHAGYLLDNIFWLWHDAIVDMNDSQEETATWSEPNDVLEFKLRLRKVNQKPMPLPMIYIFPNSDKVKINNEILADRNYLMVSIPFEEIINNLEHYIPDLAGSLKYIVEKKKELLEVQTEQDLKDIIESIDVGQRATKTVQNKLKACFNQLISEGILNISDPSAPSFIQVYDKIKEKTIYNGNPMTAVMKAECVPSFITSDLYNGKYKDAIFAYWIKTLFNESLKGTMKGRRVWIYFDELNKILDIKPENNCPATEKACNDVAARGRNNSISMLYATQSYHNIPKQIRSQTKYGISFHQKDVNAVKEFCEDFVLDKKWQNKIKILKKHECVCATSEHFICYKGDKRWEASGPFYGMSFPALHKNKFLNRTN